MLAFKNISKSFSGVQVLHNVSFTVTAGKVVALMGENGAGKSTLMKILSGVIADYEGEVVVNGAAVRFSNVREAERAGIVMIHQELNLVPGLSIGENMFLGKEPLSRFGFINFATLHEHATRILKEFDFPYGSRTPVQNITLGWQQLVEIARALRDSAALIIMDEPTSSLTEHEKDILFRKIRQLKARGTTFIYISHRLSEVFEIADEVVTMRDGRFIRQAAVADIGRDDVITAMVGKTLHDGDYRAATTNHDPVLEVKAVSVQVHKKPLLHNLNFTVHRGDVIGVAGLLGAGRTSLLKFLYGALEKAVMSGALMLGGRHYVPGTVGHAQRHKIAFLSEDRKAEGIFPLLSIRFNTSASLLPRLSVAGFIRKRKERKLALQKLQALNTRYASLHQLIVQLSGGNQQKVLLSRLLLTEPQLILLDEPTRGIDVGAREEIYRLIKELSVAGISFVVSSSEIAELNKLCNRILVLSAGHQTAFVETAQTDTAGILKNAFAKI